MRLKDLDEAILEVQEALAENNEGNNDYAEDRLLDLLARLRTWREGAVELVPGRYLEERVSVPGPALLITDTTTREE